MFEFAGKEIGDLGYNSHQILILTSLIFHFQQIFNSSTDQFSTKGMQLMKSFFHQSPLSGSGKGAQQNLVDGNNPVLLDDTDDAEGYYSEQKCFSHNFCCEKNI